MSQQMDWQDGALGLRGEGTTETVVPAQPLVPFQIKQYQTSGTPQSFFTEFIKDVLSFLRAEESETTKEYAECFDRQKARFVTHILKKLTLEPELRSDTRPDRRKFLAKMIEEMKKQGIKQVEVSFSRPLNRKMTLKKVFTAPFLATAKTKHKQTNQQTRTNTSKNPESTSKHPDSTSNNLDSTSNNLDSTSNHLDSTSSNLDSTSNNLDSTSNNLDSTSNNLDSTSNNPDSTSKSRDSTLKNQDETLLHGQNTPVTQNADSINDCITETITENHVMAVKDYFNLDSNTQPPRCAKTQAYKLICMNKIQDFIQMNDGKRRYMFECIFSSEIKAYVSTVITNVNKKVTPQFESDLECLMYGDIRKTTPEGCFLSVVIGDQNFTLHKKVCQESDIPPPVSTVLENTIDPQNNRIISNDVISGDGGDVIDKETERKTNVDETSQQKGINISAKAMSEIVSSNSATGALEETPREHPTVCIKHFDFVNHIHAQQFRAENITDFLAKRIAFNNISRCRILAAMCDVPFVCDKGARMMRQMGWQGGALGLRGEGTTYTTISAQPLAPVHIMKQYQTSRTRDEFCSEFHNDVLSFLRAEENEATIEYTECLEGRKVQFLIDTIRMSKLEKLQKRDKKFINNYKGFFKQMFEAMSKQGVQVEACISSPYKRKVTLKKVFAPLLAKDRNTSKTPGSTSNNQAPVHIKKNKISRTQDEFYSKILEDVLSFLRAEESEITIEYDKLLERGNVRFLQKKLKLLKLELRHTLGKRDKNFVIKYKLEEMFEAMSKQGVKQVEACVSRPYKNVILKKVFTTPLLATDLNTSKTPESTSNNPYSTLKNQDRTLLYSQNTSITQNADSLNDFITETITENHVMAVKDHFNLDSSNNPDSTLKNQDRTLLYSQNTSITQNADSLNDFITETITENHVMAVKDHFNLDSSIQLPRCAKTLAYKLICLTKIHLFIQMNDERRRYMFECILSSEIKAYVSTVIMNLIRKVTPQFETDLERVMYDDIRKATPAGCCLSVVIEDQNFTLLKVCQESDIPPPLSTVLENTISHQNNRIISNGVINSGRDDVILIEKKIDVIVIPDDENKQTEVNSGTVTVKTENLEKVGEKSTDDITEESLEDSLICTEFSQNFRNTDIVNMDLDNDIIELVKEIIDFTCKEFETPEDNFRALGMKSMEINNENSNSQIAGSKQNLLFSDHVQPKKERADTADFEINEKHTTDGIINPSENFKKSNITADDDESQRKMQPKENYSNEATQMYEKHPAEFFYVMHNIKDETAAETDLLEENNCRSLGNRKRSRSSSILIEPELVSENCKSEIRSVLITCKEPNEVLTVDVMRKVQSVISESIDNITNNVDFLPRLECHGVKNGGLIYSCHDEKTFSWMTNFVNSYLDLNITETDYEYPSKTHLEIKIHSFEDVDKIFNRLMLYNPDLDTILWRVIDKKEFEDFVIITVEIDRESFDIVKKHNYSLYAGIDKAKFIVI